jgi:hypothetical protein
MLKAVLPDRTMFVELKAEERSMRNLVRKGMGRRRSPAPTYLLAGTHLDRSDRGMR